MGPRVAWADVASVKRSGGGRSDSLQVLLVYPADTPAVLYQVRPLLRREALANVTRYGTPIVVSGQSLNCSLDDIGTAISRRLPPGGNTAR